MIQAGQQVVVFFRTGIELIGTVDMWSDDKSILTVDNNAYIIMKTAEDVMMVRIMQQNSIKPVEVAQEEMRELEEEFQEIYEEPSDNDLRLKKLADLKTMMIDQEKKIIAEKIRSHTISDAQKVKYGNPFYSK